MLKNNNIKDELLSASNRKTQKAFMDVDLKQKDSQSHLKTIINENSDGIVIVSIYGKILFANPAAEILLGHKQKELLNKPFGFPLIAGELTEIELIDNNSVRSIAEMRATEISWNHTHAFLIILHDITHRKKTERALRASEDKFKSIFDQSLDVILIIDSNTGNIIQVNQTVKEILGYEVNALIGKHFSILLNEKGEISNGKLNNHINIYGSVIESQYFKRADGRVRPMDVTATWVQWDTDDVILLTLRDVSDRIKAKEELSRLASVVRQASECIIITDLAGNIEYTNPAFENVSGYTVQEALGKNPRILKSGYHDQVFYENLWNTILSGKNWKGVMVNKKKDGSKYYEDAVIFPIKDDSGNIINFAAVKRDITAEKKLQDQLVQMQKLESIGLLAGGIAHDFNNIITSINGYAELLLKEMTNKNSSKEKVVNILNAGRKASGLTKQLLAFSRKQTAELKVFNVNDLILDLHKMLKRLISEDIKIENKLSTKPYIIKADPAQIEQILINLIINARDAINQKNSTAASKRITIKTYEQILDEKFISTYPGSRIGPHIVISVSDNGIGMDESTMNKIFDPFFTTKEEGKGTGLGLAMVYGIVKQNNSCIYVNSEPGKGTCFNIYWPVCTEKQVQLIKNTAGKKKDTRGGETILVVEDDDAVREIETVTLKSAGYQIVEAKNGKEALKYIKNNGKNLALILTDVVMPEMGGKELAMKVNKLFPNVKMLFSSGYTEDQIAENGILDEGVNCITKPYPLEALVKKVREVLDE